MSYILDENDKKSHFDYKFVKNSCVTIQIVVSLCYEND